MLTLPDAYRIGWYWWESWSQRRTVRALDPAAPPCVGSYGPTRDRWRRCWQAEWDGCQRAVRGYTRLGTIRRAARTMRRLAS